MSNELTQVNNFVPAPTDLNEVQRLANLLLASGYFKGVKDLAQGCVKVLAGQELGISPVQAMMGIHFVNDRLCYEAVLMGSALKRRGYTYKGAATAEKAEIVFFGPDKEQIGVSTFTIEDAKQAGLTGKNNWKNYPRNMLWARAMANGCRWFCPDVFGGPVYTPEEMGADVDGEGKILIVAEENKTAAQSLTAKLKNAPESSPQQKENDRLSEPSELAKGGTWPTVDPSAHDFETELEV